MSESLGGKVCVLSLLSLAQTRGKGNGGKDCISVSHQEAVHFYTTGRLTEAGSTTEFTRRADMSLTMRTREVNGIMIIDLSGRLTMGEASAAIRNEIHDEIGHGSRKILLNLAGVSYIDSAGLGELTSAYTSVKNRNGELKLLKLTQRVHDLMQITKLYTVFDVYDDEREAIASFGA
jgi:anti-sigma B factor antagonist